MKKYTLKIVRSQLIGMLVFMNLGGCQLINKSNIHSNAIEDDQSSLIVVNQMLIQAIANQQNNVGQEDGGDHLQEENGIISIIKTYAAKYSKYTMIGGGLAFLGITG